MRIIIDITEEQYEIIKECAKKQNDFCSEVDSAEKIISRGEPLPNNHGRLIDADELKTAFPCGESVRTECVRATIDYAQTIIPADKEEEE